MSTEDEQPFHTSATEPTLETKLAYDHGDLSWKNTLLERYGNLPGRDEQETEEAAT